MLVGNNMIIEGKGRENARIHPMLVEISILFYMKLKLKKNSLVKSYLQIIPEKITSHRLGRVDCNLQSLTVLVGCFKTVWDIYYINMQRLPKLSCDEAKEVFADTI